MEFIPPPHIILRRALMAGQQSTVARSFEHLARYLALTLCGTSSLALNAVKNNILLDFLSFIIVRFPML